MYVRTMLVLAFLAVASVASAGDITPECKVDKGVLACSYTLTSKAKTALDLSLPEGAVLQPENSCSASKLAGDVVVTCESPLQNQVAFTIRAAAALAEAGSIKIAELGEEPKEVTLAGPVGHSGRHIELVTGYGLGVRRDDSIDFQPITKDSTNVLIKNDSKGRPDILVAAKICLAHCDRTGQLGTLLGIHFVNGTSATIDGITFAFTRGIARKVYFYVGGSLGLGTEISHGFRKAAASLKDQGVPGFANRDLTNDKDFDGLPLKYQKAGATEPVLVFPGSPVIDSYNFRWTFGLAIPTSMIADIFKGDK